MVDVAKWVKRSVRFVGMVVKSSISVFGGHRYGDMKGRKGREGGRERKKEEGWIEDRYSRQRDKHSYLWALSMSTISHTHT